MKTFAIGLVPLVLLAGCTYQDPTYPAEVVTARSPADASTGIRAVRPAALTRGYRHRLPVEPKSWRERNIPPTPQLEPTS